MLTYKEAKKFYNAFGKKQDKQFYERVALDDLVRHSAFEKAKNIVEFGCGTGKLAYEILSKHAADKADYTGFDLSQTMIDLTRQRLSEFRDRVNLRLTNGTPIIQASNGSCDRFVSTYVFDLLGEQDILAILQEAHRVLERGGYLCSAGLTHGNSVLSSLVEKIWSGLFQMRPSLVGGCRPIRLKTYLTDEQWEICHYEVLVSYGVPSEVLIAKKIE